MATATVTKIETSTFSMDLEAATKLDGYFEPISRALRLIYQRTGDVTIAPTLAVIGETVAGLFPEVIHHLPVVVSALPDQVAEEMASLADCQLEVENHYSPDLLDCTTQLVLRSQRARLYLPAYDLSGPLNLAQQVGGGILVMLICKTKVWLKLHWLDKAWFDDLDASSRIAGSHYQPNQHWTTDELEEAATRSSVPEDSGANELHAMHALVIQRK